jgi:hypothetical protein
VRAAGGELRRLDFSDAAAALLEGPGGGGASAPPPGLHGAPGAMAPRAMAPRAVLVADGLGDSERAALLEEMLARPALRARAVLLLATAGLARTARLRRVQAHPQVAVVPAPPLSDAEAPPPPPTPSRTKWTRRVPHPVLIGHAASLRPRGCSRRAPRASRRAARRRPARRRPRRAPPHARRPRAHRSPAGRKQPPRCEPRRSAGGPPSSQASPPLPLPY